MFYKVLHSLDQLEDIWLMAIGHGISPQTESAAVHAPQLETSPRQRRWHPLESWERQSRKLVLMDLKWRGKGNTSTVAVWCGNPSYEYDWSFTMLRSAANLGLVDYFALIQIAEDLAFLCTFNVRCNGKSKKKTLKVILPLLPMESGTQTHRFQWFQQSLSTAVELLSDFYDKVVAFVGTKGDGVQHLRDLELRLMVLLISV